MQAITCRNIREIISLRAVDATRLSCYAICVISVICGSLSSCSIATQLESDSAYRDSVAAHYAEHLRYLAEFDTVYVHDSVFIREAGDSVYVFKYRDRYKYRDRAVHDTINRTDTVTKTQTITKTITRTIKPPPAATRSPLALSERARVLGKGCLIGGIGALLLALILYVFLRFYRRR